MNALSPSKVDTFFGCRRLFSYKYIVKPPVFVEQRHFLIGNLAHKALEEFHTYMKVQGSEGLSTASLMGDCFRHAVRSHNAFAKVESGVISKDDLNMIKGMLQSYIKLYSGFEIKPKVLCTEKLEKFKINGIQVNLKADRIDEVSTGIHRVIDYKTSAKPASKKDEADSVQLPSYGLLIKHKFGDVSKKIYGDYYYLRHLDKPSGIHSYELTEEMMEIAANKYSQVNELLENGCSFEKNEGYKFCFNCEYKRNCRTED